MKQPEESNVTLYTAQEVADMLKVTVGTVWTYVREGRLDCLRIGKKRTIRFTKDQILHFIGGNGNDDVHSPLDDRHT